jgi:hypothetical protein
MNKQAFTIAAAAISITVAPLHLGAQTSTASQQTPSSAHHRDAKTHKPTLQDQIVALQQELHEQN